MGMVRMWCGAGLVLLGGLLGTARADQAPTFKTALKNIPERLKLQDPTVPQELDALAAAPGRTPDERAQLEMWRAAWWLGQNNKAATDAALAVAKGCNKKVKVPKGAPPKLKPLLKKAAPAPCPVKGNGDSIELDMDDLVAPAPAAAVPAASNPEPATAPAADTGALLDGPSAADLATAPPPKDPDETVNKGSLVPVMGAAGLAGAALPVVLVSTALMAAALSSLLGNYGVAVWANSQDNVVTHRRGLQAAFLMFVGGGVTLPVAGLVGLLALVVGLGAALAAVVLRLML